MQTANILRSGSPPRNRQREEEHVQLRVTAAGLFILTIADSIALGWLGMWAGLRVRHVPNGAALCLCKVVLPAGIVAAAFICNYGLTSADEYLKTNPYWIPALWLGVGLVTDLGWGLWARNKLLTEFRLAATDRFQRRQT
jgi:hypothetical protein